MKDAFFITYVGMGLVFMGLLALWLLMALLVRFTSKRKQVLINPTPESKGEENDQDFECKQKAAAAAVAAVMALMNATLSASSHNENERLSPWQTAHRFHSLNTSIKSPIRKDTL
jgi:Na+-transporting methylmalonyl-CoA/oxaloacetate decarboxylase gamma subunit